jgi:hypothetical protein
LSRRERMEGWLAGPMFALGCVYLLLLAGVISRGREFDTAGWDTLEARVLVIGLLVLWPVFVIEALVRFFLHDRSRRGLRTLTGCLAAGVLPPLRLGTRSAVNPDWMWLPGMGWRRADYDLQKALEDLFGGPMLVMAFLILPVLAVEYGWSAAIADNAALRLVLAMGISAIWIAFATEFAVRFGAADNMRRYTLKHWLDLAVVLLPTFEFLPFLRVLRVTRVMRLETLFAWTKYYRLYGLAGKGWRALMVLQVLHRMFDRSPQARLARMKVRLAGREQAQREMNAEFEREIDYYRRRIAELERDAVETGDGPA